MATGTIPSKTQYQADLALKAPIASPTFTGAPLVPTATAGTSTTQAASTAFVAAAALVAQSQHVAVNTVTSTTYTAVAGDAGDVNLMNNTSAITVTIPATTYAVGTVLKFVQYNTGIVTIAPATNVVFRYTNGLRTNGQYASIALTLIIANEWLVEGNTQV